MNSINIQFLQPDDLNNLKRFDETCEDSQPYDVPKEKMQRLAELGVVRRHSKSYYSITSFGMYVLNQNDELIKLPLKTESDHNEDFMFSLANKIRGSQNG
ncbi:hypothetical protein M0R25_003436 [Morganella morganii]|uniref:hypothetical protein n=1 Tax=Morganella morganii TaxID=582 RepID=UPI0019676B35|nr:hypothetical protein [Morganella morganii]EKW3937501.1 hypothetical protein [Morganella morganii]EKW3940999.1 hypothetical protein [Morganella morganii]MBT0499344.1 hypothetical protein [Morganella morganii subsp. morganii]QSB91985.1 hypothetical protein JW297_06825 [Morganella morganii]QWL96631.1 hypothetical protein IZ183_17350 [Morganella morganii subsp. morganii]